MRERERETREFQEGQLPRHKRPEERCPLSRIEKTGKGNARLEQSSSALFWFYSAISVVDQIDQMKSVIGRTFLSVSRYMIKIYFLYKLNQIRSNYIL